MKEFKKNQRNKGPEYRKKGGGVNKAVLPHPLEEKHP